MSNLSIVENWCARYILLLPEKSDSANTELDVLLRIVIMHAVCNDGH